jgi:hypothetical protein
MGFSSFWFWLRQRLGADDAKGPSLDQDGYGM